MYVRSIVCTQCTPADIPYLQANKHNAVRKRSRFFIVNFINANQKCLLARLGGGGQSTKNSSELQNFSRAHVAVPAMKKGPYSLVPQMAIKSNFQLLFQAREHGFFHRKCSVHRKNGNIYYCTVCTVCVRLFGHWFEFPANFIDLKINTLFCKCANLTYSVSKPSLKKPLWY